MRLLFGPLLPLACLPDLGRRAGTARAHHSRAQGLLIVGDDMHGLLAAADADIKLLGGSSPARGGALGQGRYVIVHALAGMAGDDPVRQMPIGTGDYPAALVDQIALRRES